MTTLGNTLKKARKNLGLTLRAVETETGISNPYLSQLERDKIKQPSPQFLGKLAQLYKIPFDAVMKIAGYVSPENAGGSEELATAVSGQFNGEPISPEEEDKLKEYLEFLRSKQK